MYGKTETKNVHFSPDVYIYAYINIPHTDNGNGGKIARKTQPKTYTSFENLPFVASYMAAEQCIYNVRGNKLFHRTGRKIL